MGFFSIDCLFITSAVRNFTERMKGAFYAQYNFSILVSVC